MWDCEDCNTFNEGDGFDKMQVGPLLGANPQPRTRGCGKNKKFFHDLSPRFVEGCLRIRHLASFVTCATCAKSMEIPQKNERTIWTKLGNYRPKLVDNLSYTLTFGAKIGAKLHKPRKTPQLLSFF